MFHKEILTEEQVNLLSLIRKFKRKFYLVGGTAIALHIGHRRSIDFDLFTDTRINRGQLEVHIAKQKLKFKTLHQTPQEWTLFIGSVKITFYQFPHSIETENDFEKIINIPSLLTLAAMKVYALGGRAKWKDYVDLYFIFKSHFSLEEVCAKADEIFGERFNERLLREQLSYFADVNYDEAVEYIVPEPSMDEIKNYLTQVAVK